MASRVAVGFIGLGNMGGKMAMNMAARFALGRPARHRLVAFDPRPSAAQELVVRHPTSASAAASVRDVARVCGTVVLCLPNGAVVRDVVAEVMSDLPSGALVLDCSTTGADVAREVAAELSTRGVRFLDTPVTGAPERAATGTLTVMVGGGSEHLAEARPILDTFANRVLHVGNETGSGQIAKALNNCLYNVSVAAMAEILPLAVRAGLRPETFVEAVMTGTGQSFGFQQWAPRVLSREFEAPRFGFPMGDAFKDLETLQAVAEECGSCMPPVVASARQTYQRALDMGLGGEHKGAMVKVWESDLGVECRRGTEAAALDTDSR